MYLFILEIGTFKLKKTTLRDEGFDVNKVKDRIFFLDPVSRKYQLLSQESYQDIMEKRVRL